MKSVLVHGSQCEAKVATAIDSPDSCPDTPSHGQIHQPSLVSSHAFATGCLRKQPHHASLDPELFAIIERGMANPSSAGIDLAPPQQHKHDIGVQLIAANANNEAKHIRAFLLATLALNSGKTWLCNQLSWCGSELSAMLSLRKTPACHSCWSISYSKNSSPRSNGSWPVAGCASC